MYEQFCLEKILSAVLRGSKANSNISTRNTGTQELTTHQPLYSTSTHHYITTDMGGGGIELQTRNS